jgi:hypothetical protein
LDAAEVNPANVAALVEAENGTGLVERDVLGEADNIPVERASNVLELPARSAPGTSNSTPLHVRRRR